MRNTNPPQWIAQAVVAALQQHRSGNTQAAETLYRKVLDAVPGHSDARHLLGVLLSQAGQTREGSRLIRSAIKRSPRIAGYHNSLANVLAQSGNTKEAERHYRTALKLDPHLEQVHTSLCHLLSARNQLDQAENHCRRAITLNDANPEAHNNLGNVLEKKGDVSEALIQFKHALALRPEFPEALSNLGMLLLQRGDTDDAETHLRHAIALKQDSPDLHSNLGNLHRQHGAMDKAIARFRLALELNPQHLSARLGLGNTFKDQGNLSGAIEQYQQALRVLPDDPSASSNLAVAYWAQGRSADAVSCLRHTMKRHPDWTDSHSNLLFFLNSDPTTTPAQVFREHLKWGKRHGNPRHRAPFSHDNVPDPDRPLRIGYISSDFRIHPVASFIEPVLAGHQHLGKFEIHCYASIAKPDETTQRLRALVTNWRNIGGLADAEVAGMIRSDAIDILIDLGGHTSKSRLPVLAHRPAPVQMSYLGYPNTTGLAAVDYRITDARADPPGFSDTIHSEKLLRLANGFLCFAAPTDAPEPSPLPALMRGHITFGSFNNISKVSPDTVELWASILKQSPDSRLMMKARGLEDPPTADRFRSLFRSHGITPERLDFIGYLPGKNAHFAAYQEIDIALDPFPYNGTTTSCEALWMGIPVITLAGTVHAGRVGTSLLTTLGLKSWIAESKEAYCAVALDWTHRLDELTALREGIRRTMRKSPLMDQQGFVRGLEQCYREAWRNWCATVAPTHSSKTAKANIQT